jgi:hypothetical protein
MKTIKTALLLIVIAYSGYSQNQISINLSYPFPAYPNSFSDNYIGIINAGIEYSHKFKNKMVLGIGYNQFAFNNKSDNELDKMYYHIFSPYICLKYPISFSDVFFIIPQINTGYSWMRFYNKVTPDDVLKSFNEDGFIFSPVLNLETKISSSVMIGLTSSYNIIFEQFGKKSQQNINPSTLQFITTGVTTTFTIK